MALSIESLADWRDAAIADLESSPIALLGISVRRDLWLLVNTLFPVPKDVRNLLNIEAVRRLVPTERFQALPPALHDISKNAIEMALLALEDRAALDLLRKKANTEFYAIGQIWEIAEAECDPLFREEQTILSYAAQLTLHASYYDEPCLIWTNEYCRSVREMLDWDLWDVPHCCAEVSAVSTTDSNGRRSLFWKTWIPWVTERLRLIYSGRQSTVEQITDIRRWISDW